MIVGAHGRFFARVEKGIDRNGLFGESLLGLGGCGLVFGFLQVMNFLFQEVNFSFLNLNYLPKVVAIILIMLNSLVECIFLFSG